MLRAPGSAGFGRPDAAFGLARWMAGPMGSLGILRVARAEQWPLD